MSTEMGRDVGTQAVRELLNDVHERIFRSPLLLADSGDDWAALAETERRVLRELTDSHHAGEVDARLLGVLERIADLRSEHLTLDPPRPLHDDAVRRALSELRSAPTVAAVMDRAVEALCEHCGFDRAFLFRVEQSEMWIESVHYVSQPDWADEFLELANSFRPQLHHQLRETEMIRRREPMLVRSPATDDRTFKPLVIPAKTRSYVAAPVMPNDNVVGFLHADCYFQDRDVTAADRDRLWAFAEGFGFALDRAALTERLRAQGSEIERLMSAAGEVLAQFTQAPLRVARDGFPSEQSQPVPLRAPGIDYHRIHSLLTRREFEVMELLCQGATNSHIARQLVISEATVKSHVKHLMRKLRAGNRTEAVARFRRIAGETTAA